MPSDVATVDQVHDVLVTANQLLGLAFAIGRSNRFSTKQARHIALFSSLGVVGVVALTSSGAAKATSAVPVATLAGVLLLVFAASLPRSIHAQRLTSTETAITGRDQQWPVWFAVTILLLCSGGAALVSSWLVDAMAPAINTLHVSQTFTGIVIVGIAGNAVGNACGVLLARQGKYDTAISIILNSPLQILVLLVPALVLATFSFNRGMFVTDLSPALLGAVILGTLAASAATIDGTAHRQKGLVLLLLFGATAILFW